ncbi:MAG: hypothetical protein LBH62_08870 [Nitrososphaerota archaeon]|jgi:hypothetical protein|nr:hypothetical protein [Nitrososphaerota archaeon]
MNPAGDYTYMIKTMKGKYENGSKVVGIIFASPNESLARDEILMRIPDFNQASGGDIDFFFAGYSKYNTNRADQQEIMGPNSQKWYYSPRMFYAFVDNIEDISRWKYSGVTDLLLLEFRGDTLQFNKVITICINKNIKEESIRSVGELFQRIWNIAQRGGDIEEFRKDLTGKGFIDKLWADISNYRIARIFLPIYRYSLHDYSKK